MCGISGVAQLGGGALAPSTYAVLDRMVRILSHRGPDDNRLVLEGAVGLAFTRLSLVDPANGGQPLVSPDGNLVLIANGEVYNYRELSARLGVTLTTGSDCEILLHLYAKYGMRFLEKVNGMFAIVLWDRRNGDLIMARDRFGIKPLYYHRSDQRIVFGSEIKSLFADPATPRRLDWASTLRNPVLTSAPSLDEYAQATWFEGVHNVPAGTVQKTSLLTGRTESLEYWRFPGAAAELPSNDQEVIDRYADLLAASVADCVTADAEVGIFLSGGVDSALVTALAAQHTKEIHTFTVLNAGTHQNRDAEYARRVAELLGVPNHQVVFGVQESPTAAQWRRLLWLSETPACNPEVYYKHELHRYAKQVRPEIRGMLLGAAADEFGGGYSTELAVGGSFQDFERNIRSLTLAGARGRSPALGTWIDADLLSNHGLAALTDVSLDDPYQNYLRWEYNKIQQYNCWHEDRTAAGSGIEARVPFLDHRMVELLASIPPARRESLLWDKRLIREAAKRLLPTDIAQRTKVAFFHGAGERAVYESFAAMLADDGAALLEEALAAPGAADFLDADRLHRSLRQCLQEPRSDNVEALLRAVNVGLLAAMVAELPAPTIEMDPGPQLRAAELAPEDLDGSSHLGHDVTLDALVRLNDGVLLSRAGDDWYLAIDGVIEYEPEHEWLEVLRAADGSLTVGDMKAVGPDRYSIVLELVNMKVLRLDGPALASAPGPS